MNFGALLASLFSTRPAPTGNPDVDELRLYNYLAAVCELCGGSPAHAHGELLHCDTCCRARAAAALREHEARTQGGSQGRGA